MADEGWTEAVSDKAKRKQKLQQKNWDESVRIVEEHAKKNAIPLPKGYQKRLQDVEPKNAIAVLNDLIAAGKAPQAKTKTKAVKGNKWDSPDELVDIIRGIVQSAPFVDVAGVGSKLQALTNHPWNKKFKPVYGALNTFIKSYPKEFHVDENDRIYIRSEWKAAEKKKQEDRAQAKKAGNVGESNTSKKAANKKKPVTAKSRWTLCGCLDFSSPFLLLFMGLLYISVCTLVLAQGNVHHSLVDYLTAKRYISRADPNVATFLSAGDGVKAVGARLLVLYQQYLTQFLKWYAEFRKTNETWKAIEEVFLLGLLRIWQAIVHAWNATIGGTSTGLMLERWTASVQSTQAWQSVAQNFNRLLSR